MTGHQTGRRGHRTRQRRANESRAVAAAEVPLTQNRTGFGRVTQYRLDAGLPNRNPIVARRRKVRLEFDHPRPTYQAPGNGKHRCAGQIITAENGLRGAVPAGGESRWQPGKTGNGIGGR